VYVPVGVTAVVVIVIVVEQVGVQCVGEKEAVAPEGRPEVEKERVWAAPVERVAVRVFETDWPCVTVRLPALEIEKSKATVLLTVTVTAEEMV
jgi:hypothetical protein